MRTLLIAFSVSLILGCTQKTSEEHLTSAQEFVEQNKFNSAVIELKSAVQADPKNPKARFELGKVYLRQKQYESAEKELNRALEYGQPASDVIPLLSQAYQNSGAYAELSEIDHSEAGMTPEQEIEVGFFKLQSLAQLGKEADAKLLLEQLSTINADTVYSGLVEVFGLVLNQNIDEAINKTDSLAQKYPENADVLKLQGQLYLRTQQADKAAEVYEKYLALYPEDTQIVFVLAKLLVDNGKITQAEPYIDQLLAINQDNALLNQLKSVVSAAKNEHENAQKYAEKAIQSGRGDPVLRLIAGHAAYVLKDYEAANTHLSYIASSLPANHPALKMLAASQLELGLSEDASNVLEMFSEVTEQDAKLFSKAGYELIRAGNLIDAKEVVARSAEISRSAEDLTRLGVLRLSLNDVSGIIDLENALEQSPDMDVTRATLANAYLATRQFDKAQELADEWIASNPEDFKAYMLAGELAIKQSDFDSALAMYKKAEALDPENGLIKLAIANLDIAKGNRDSGHEKLLAILSKKPSFIPALASYYLSHRQLKESAKGMQPALTALQNEPQNTDLKLVVARMYLTEQDWNQVLTTLESIPENDSIPSSFWNLKGKALLGIGGIADANQHYDKWLASYPNSRDANLGKMLLLDAKGDFAEGAKLSSRFLEARDDLSVEVLRTHFLVMSRQFEEAKAALAKLPEATQQLPVVKGFKARIQMSDQEYADALVNSEAVYEAIPNSRNAVLLAVNLERLDQKSQALALLQKHAEKYPNDIAVKMMVAERQISGDEEKAIATYEKTLELNPNNFVVLNNLAYLYAQNGRLKEAEKYAKQAVEQHPNNPDAVDTLAQALMKQEKYEEALKYYDRVINDSMENNEIYLNYVEVLLASGNNSLARRKLVERTFTDENTIARVKSLKTQYGI
ncbi:XrtA/PEP-CTERM system TPR-repeat protein PrsT [Aliiglaciecola sp. NS0011-25]|uniref:XrtA/PEP-CTERM system TPR-repeat protein PrsT n=1 Tax=Aliiglaciecola sp. NS0011-25 TaxID=3127654 RepID=UPI00310507BA